MRDQLDRALSEPFRWTIEQSWSCTTTRGYRSGRSPRSPRRSYGTVGSRLHHATRALRAAIAAGDRVTAQAEGSRHDRTFEFDRLLASVLDADGPQAVPPTVVEAALTKSRAFKQAPTAG